MFSCIGNFAHMDHDEPPSMPREPSKKKQNKNPYATRGLDKFSMILAELEKRREKIIERAGSQGVAMIMFMYDNSQDWVPIIVRPKEGKAEVTQLKKLTPPQVQTDIEVKEKQEVVKKDKVIMKKRRLAWNMLRWRDSYYWAFVMVLILVCLVMFGRVFAICCTSIWWYMLPTMKKKFFKEEEINGRRLSEKRLGRHVKKG